MPADSFFDTNVLVYLLSADTAKADRAARLLRKGGVISVQVLNELVNVARRKCKLDWGEMRELLDGIRRLCRVEPLGIEVHERALELAERHRFAFYDALIVASALQAGCNVLYSEDMQHGMQVEKRLAIRNPFS